jgi:hypothetical protein
MFTVLRLSAIQGQTRPDSAPPARLLRLSLRISQRFPANSENSHVKIMHVLFVLCSLFGHESL